MIIPHSKSIRLPRFSRRIPFCVDTRMIRWNFPYIESNYKTERELYTWDYRNRLTSVTKQTYNAETGTWENVQIVEYTYDYNNVWIRKTLDSNGDGTADSKTIFIPENYQTVTQIDNNTITHHYLWTPNTQDKLLADVTTNDVLWALTDHLGTIRDIVGNSTIHLIYDAFGNIISCKNSAGEMVNNPLLFAYTGKAFDTSTALQNNINRWYDPTTGRWLSQDPIGFNGSDTNLYRYVKNNLLNQLDFNGLLPCHGGTWTYSGYTAGGEIMLGYYSSIVTFKCGYGTIKQRKVYEYCKDGTTYTIEKDVIYVAVAEGTMYTGSAGVGVGGSVKKIYGGRVYEIFDSNQLNGFGYPYVSLSLDAGIVGGGFDGGYDTGDGQIGLGLGFGGSIALQFTKTKIHASYYEIIEEEFTSIDKNAIKMFGGYDSCKTSYKPVIPEEYKNLL